MAGIRRTLPLNSLFLAVVAPAIALSTAGFGYATYVRLYSTILEGFDRKLAAISSAMSVFIDADEALDLLSQKDTLKARGQDPEQHPTYLRYVEPMRRLRADAGLTFLYTQVLNPGTGQQCTYLIDGTVGEGHSEIGAVDTIPADDWDVALRVVHDGAIAQTGIKKWEQWGLLKCGWAPIYGSDGQIKAMAGADVEITVIRKKTYVALIETIGVGALALAVAGFVSVRVARRLTHPLGSVREAALRIASGNYRARCHVDNPTEMRRLAGTLNGLAQMMERTIADARPRMQTWRRTRASAALLDALMPQAQRSAELATLRPSGGDASGLVVDRHRVLLWLGRREADALAARRTSRDLEHIARGLIRRFGDEAIDRIPSAVGERASAFAAIDLHEWTLRLSGGGLAAFVLAAGGSRRVAGGTPTVIDPGETVVIVPADAASIATRLAPRPASETIDAIATAAAGVAPAVALSIHRPESQERVA
jgi:HAMP domain-containing protein